MKLISFIASLAAVTWLTSSATAEVQREDSLEAAADDAPASPAVERAARRKFLQDRFTKKYLPTITDIRKALSEETKFDITDMPLRDVAKLLGDLHQISFLVDSEELAAAGFGVDLTVTADLRHMSLDSALRVMLGELGLGYIIEDRSVLITTPSKVDRRRFAAALEHETRFQFDEAPLATAVQFLSDLHGIPIKIDHKSLNEAGFGADVPVTRKLEGISLGCALNLMLGELELTYIVENEVLLIVTPATAEMRPTIKLYPVGVFLDEGWDVESLKRVVKMHTAADCELLGRHLAMHQSQPSHRKTARLMRDLAVAAGTQD